MPFLSLLDDRAKPKGSRDPLGFELIWTHYGRRVIGNLTTITGSLTNFTVAILGFKWANDLHVHRPEFDCQASIRDTFLRYEQLAAYLRYSSDDTQIMGITRVQRRMEDGRSWIGFGIGSQEQILSDQASYGLWGLYSSVMREAGLVKGDNRLPTSLGLGIAQAIEDRLDSEHMISVFQRERVSKDELKKLAASYQRAINTHSEQDKLLHALMGGSNKMHLQQELWCLTQKMKRQKEVVISVADFIVKIKAYASKTLTERLSEIEQVERVLVAANNIFNYCRRKDGSTLDNVVCQLDQRYSFQHLSNEFGFDGLLSTLGEQRIALLTKLQQALRANNVHEVLMQLIELNRVVMALRGACPWVELESGRILRIRVPSETAQLLEQHELESRWDHDYFIGSYINIASQGLGQLWKVP